MHFFNEEKLVGRESCKCAHTDGVSDTPGKQEGLELCNASLHHNTRNHSLNNNVQNVIWFCGAVLLSQVH